MDTSFPRSSGAVTASIVAWAACSGFACSGSVASVSSTGSSGSRTSSSSSGAVAGSSGGAGSSAGSSGAAGGSSGSGGASSGGSSGGSSGSGGSDAGGSGGGGVDSGPPSICDGAGTRLLTLADTFIDDFEECAISPGWSSFNDVMPQHDVFKIQQTAGGALGTAHCGRYTGTGAIVTSAGGFGVGTVYNVAIDPAAQIYCVDVSQFDGVSFWAKAATDGSKVSLNFVVPETNPKSTDPMGRPNGGDCVANCYNHPRATVTLTTTWARYVVAFSEATGGSAKVAGRIQELAWLSPDSNWDFSLDEISFYSGTAPTGAVGPGPKACP